MVSKFELETIGIQDRNTNDLNDDEVGYVSYVIATLGSRKVGIGFNVKHVTS
jgi:hypothetical protein